MQYESVTQEIVLFIELILQIAKQLQTSRLSLHVRCPSGIQFPSKYSLAFAM
jgi:hypothetical protein